MLMNVVCFAFVYYAMIRAVFPARYKFASRCARGRTTWRLFVPARQNDAFEWVFRTRRKRSGTMMVARYVDDREGLPARPHWQRIRVREVALKLSRMLLPALPWRLKPDDGVLTVKSIWTELPAPGTSLKINRRLSQSGVPAIRRCSRCRVCDDARETRHRTSALSIASSLSARSVDHLDDLLFARIDEHDLLADR
jgi:hypothetical protein